MAGLFGDVVPARGRAQRQLARPSFVEPADYDPHVELPELHGIVALDSENKDPGLAQGTGSSWPHQGVGFNCGFALSWEGGDLYASIRHGGGNTDGHRVIDWLRAQARKPDVTFVYANCQHDIGWLWREGIEPINLPHDVQGMAALLDEYKYSYSLDSLGREELDRGKSDEAFMAACAAGGLIDPKSNMDLVPGWIAAPYGMNDARLTLDLYHVYKTKMIEEDLTQVYELERECYLAGVDMKRQGVRVNTDRALQHIQQFERARDDCLEQVRVLTGVACRATDLQSLAGALLAENSSLILPKTTRGDWAMRKEVLDSLHSPVADLINKARRYEKAVNTFLRGYVIGSSVRGRIHADFNPLRRTDPDGEDGASKGTTTGRWSCTDPNLQNVPTRDPEIGTAIRECFLPEPGEQWGKLDFSAQEPRLGVHFAELARLPGAREMGDRFRANPRTDLHQETATLMSIERSPAKIINLAIWYGAATAEIARRLGLPTEMKDFGDGPVEIAGPQAMRLIRQHHRNMPFVKGLQKKTQEWAERRGYVRTLFKRRCRFQGSPGNYRRTYKACNSVIQGSAADQMKAAQVQMRRAGILPLIVVHDDSNVSIPMGTAGERKIARIKEIMETAVTLTIPVIADVKIGANWAEVRG